MPPDTRRWLRRGPAIRTDPSDGTIVFDPSTGETHFLGELPALLVSVVDETPVSLEDLVERLAGSVALDQQARTQINNALLFLEAAELVESENV